MNGPTSIGLGGGSTARERPWWSAIDVLLAIIWWFGATILASLVVVVAVAIAGDDLSDEPIYAVFFGTLVFQVAQAAFPFLVSKWKGLGIEADWRFTSSLPADIGYGLILALICLVGAQLTSVLAASAVGLDDIEDASNTSILVDSKGSVWLIGVIALVVVGAPLVEELLFRGLILRALEKSLGPVVAIGLSTVMFALPHWQPDATWQETVVLVSSIAVVGLVLAIGTIRSGRLGPAVIGHFLFNGAGTLLTLL